jgi:hypothetical protein
MPKLAGTISGGTGTHKQERTNGKHRTTYT